MLGLTGASMATKRVTRTRPVELDPESRAQIDALMRSVKAEYRLRQRATMVWRVAEEQQSLATVAHSSGVTVKTVSKWVHRVRLQGVNGLEDAPRSGAPGHFDVVQRCEVFAIACDSPGNYGWEGQALWTLDMLTETVNHRLIPPMSRSTVARTLKEGSLKPHKTQMWLHSPDPQFKEKVNDIVSLYLAPPDPDVAIVSVDEKTGMQANERKYPTTPPPVGRAGRIEYEYRRHGTLSLIAGFDVTSGPVYAEWRARRTAEDLLEFMDGLATQYPDKKKVIIIWDNLNIHHAGATDRWAAFNARHGNKFEFHYTPLHASWVNQVEIFFSIVYKRALKKASFVSTDDLRRRVMAFIARWNGGAGHPFHWTFRGYPMQSQEVA